VGPTAGLENPNATIHGSLAEIHCGRCKPATIYRTLTNSWARNTKHSFYGLNETGFWGSNASLPRYGLDLNRSVRSISVWACDLATQLWPRDLLHFHLGSQLSTSPLARPDWGGTSFMTLELTTLELDVGVVQQGIAGLSSPAMVSNWILFLGRS